MVISVAYYQQKYPNFSNIFFNRCFGVVSNQSKRDDNDLATKHEQAAFTLYTKTNIEPVNSLFT